MKRWTCAIAGCLLGAVAVAQTQAPAPAESAPQGTVLFQSHGAPPEPADSGALPTASLPNQTPAAKPAGKGDPTGPELTDADRGAVRFTAYDLDARFSPASAGLVMRAHVTLRNDGPKPLTRVAMQVSSTLRWESVSSLTERGAAKLEFAQHLLDTDADHTGQANEVVVTLPEELAPGGTVQLDVFYSGTLAASEGRLLRLGATAVQAGDSDWDAVSAQGVALRGFGNVLWYPVAAPQLFLGEGAQLFAAVGAMRLREQAATMHMKMSVEYVGDAPTAAYFCGRRQAFKVLPDSGDAPIVSASGLAVVEFPAEALGFREPSLFTVNQPEKLAGRINFSSSSAEQGGAAPVADGVSSSAGVSSAAADDAAAAPTGLPLLAVESSNDGAVAALGASARQVAPLLQQWMGDEPLSALTVIDHPGQPFEDGPLLVAPAEALAEADARTALVHSLTHAWVQTGQPWMDEGLAQFFALLWTEQQLGRESALAQLAELLAPLPLVEPDISPASAKEPGAAHELVGQVVGQPLIAASSEVYYRRKAAAVWWMLRDIVGDEALGAALQTWRQRVPADATAENEALAFEQVLEHAGKQNEKNPISLRWFFNDWVLHDRGLPDLTIADVTPRVLPPRPGQGASAGFLVSVTVRNDGAAEAQVPVTIRSGTYSTTSQLRVPGFASAAARVVVEAVPTEVLVNDGTVPETRTMFHTVKVSGVRTQP